jgi:hypothetical protein
MDCLLITASKGWSKPVPGRERRSFATLLRDKGRSSGIFIALEGVAGDALSLRAGFFHVAAAMAFGLTVLVVTGAELETFGSSDELVRLLRRRMLDQVRGRGLELENLWRKADRTKAQRKKMPRSE